MAKKIIRYTNSHHFMDDISDELLVTVFFGNKTCYTIGDALEISFNKQHQVTRVETEENIYVLVKKD